MRIRHGIIQSVSITDMPKFILIHCQHRTGSTALLRTLGRIEGVWPVPEELNIAERAIIPNTLWNYARGTWPRHDCLRGSFWQKDGQFWQTAKQILGDVRNLDRATLSGFVQAVIQRIFLASMSVDERHSIRYVTCKYAVHISRSERLIKEMSDVKHIILVRELRAIILSKINDPQMRKLRAKSSFIFSLKRMAVLFYFSWDYLMVVRLVRATRDCGNCYIVRYENFSSDFQLFCRDNHLSYHASQGIANGKESSVIGNIIQLSALERSVARFCDGFVDFR